jgi:hypothetical protein
MPAEARTRMVQPSFGQQDGVHEMGLECAGGITGEST